MIRPTIRNRSKPYPKNVEAIPKVFWDAVNDNSRDFIAKSRAKLPKYLSSEENLELRIVDFETNESLPIKLENLLEENEVAGSFSKACDHVCIIGSEGSGKTSLLANFINKALNGELPDWDSEKNIVHVIDCQSLFCVENVSVCDILFADMKDKLSQEDFRKGYNWVATNSSKITFVLDGIHCLMKNFKNVPSIGAYEKSSTENIINSLMSGVMFLSCHIVSTCDEQKIEKYMDDDGKLELSKIILISGYSHKSISDIALKCLGKDRYAHAFPAFESDVYMMRLCEHPAFLTTALACVKKCDNETPKGLTNLFLHIITKIKIRSNVLDKLKHASYLAKRNKRRILRNRHLTAAGLEVDDLRNEFSPSQEDKIVCEEWLGNKRRFVFQNPVFLEILTALYIAETDVDGFSGMIAKWFDDHHFVTVFACLSGIIFDDKNFEMALKLVQSGSVKYNQVKACRAEKVILLKSRIASRLDALPETIEIKQQFDLFHIITECGRQIREVLVEHFNDFSLTKFGSALLTNVDMCALAVCICHRSVLNSITFADCNLPTCLIETFHECISNIKSVPQIKSLSLESTYESQKATDDDAVIFAKFLTHVTLHCDLTGWYFSPRGKETLQKKLNKKHDRGMKVLIGKDEILNPKGNWVDIAEKYIPTDGGSMLLNDCSLVFQKGSLLEESKVTMEMKNYIEFYPEEYLVMSPVVNVALKSGLRKPVIVTMQPWCFVIDERDRKSLQVEVLHLEDDGEKWDVTETAIMDEKGSVNFKCKNFSSIITAIKRIFLPKFYFPMTAFILRKSTQWCVAYCMAHRSNMKETKEELKEYGYEELHPPINKFKARINDAIEVKFSVENTSPFFLDIQKQNAPIFHLNEQYTQRPQYIMCTFNMKQRSPHKGNYTLYISFETFLNDNKLPNGDGSFSCEVSAEGAAVKEERLEDAIKDIVERFANSDEFKNFAMAKEGLCLSISDIGDRNRQTTLEWKLEMFRIWASRKGKPTGKTLRNLVDAYFAAFPCAQIEETLKIEDEFVGAMSLFNTYHEWKNFATSTKGLGFSEQEFERRVGDQENITLEQKKKMLEMWKYQQGGGVSAGNFTELMRSYLRARNS